MINLDFNHVKLLKYIKSLFWREFEKFFKIIKFASHLFPNSDMLKTSPLRGDKNPFPKSIFQKCLF